MANLAGHIGWSIDYHYVYMHQPKKLPVQSSHKNTTYFLVHCLLVLTYCVYFAHSILMFLYIFRDALKIIVQRGAAVMKGEHRLVWSPHIHSEEEEEEEQDICSIVITHGNCVSRLLHKGRQ